MRRLLALLLAALLLVAACGGDEAGPASADPGPGEPAPEGIDGVVAYAVDDNSHVEGSVDYGLVPAVGGPHHPVWANCGVYDDEVPAENVVHSLEHGAVWIAHGDDTPAGDLQALEALAGQSDHVLVSVVPDLDSPLVLTAWNRQLAVDAADDPRVEEFLQTYLDGPTAPEAAAPCTGGAG